MSDRESEYGPCVALLLELNGARRPDDLVTLSNSRRPLRAPAAPHPTSVRQLHLTAPASLAPSAASMAHSMPAFRSPRAAFWPEMVTLVRLELTSTFLVAPSAVNV